MAVSNDISIELLGVERLETFDAVSVLVSFESLQEKRQYKLIGSCLITEGAAKAAALSVLDATNQLLGSNLRFLKHRLSSAINQPVL